MEPSFALDTTDDAAILRGQASWETITTPPNYARVGVRMRVIIYARESPSCVVNAETEAPARR